ncbi:MAG: MIP/aquaporin family protein [Pirellulales bacterium]
MAHSQSVSPSLASRCAAEMLGTFILVLFGCGSVHAAVLTGAQSGLWQVAIVWGVAIMLAVYVVGGISGAHINPAISVALAVWGKFSWKDVLPYAVAQFLGAFVAAAALFAMYTGPLDDLESRKHVVRGQPGSEITAMCYGEYFPNPGALGAGDSVYSAEQHDKLNRLVTPRTAFLAELLGTLLLGLVVAALTDDRHHGGPAAGMAPVFIGLTVSVLISIIAPLTQACFNPARDFGPRVFACLAGWGNVALPGSRGAAIYAVYLAAPIIGAALGMGLYFRLLKNWLPPASLPDRQAR